MSEATLLAMLKTQEQALAKIDKKLSSLSASATQPSQEEKIEKIERLATSMEQVGASMKWVNSSMEQVNTSVEQVNSSVEQMSTSMEQITTSNAEQSAELKQTIEEARKPVVNRNIHEVNFNSSRTFYLILASVFSVIFLGLTTFKALQPNTKEQDNDLKYRYIKMQGEATPAMIGEIEGFFGRDRNPKAVNALRKKVETFEEAVRKQAYADEQARLNILESERQESKARSLQNR